MSAEPFVRYLIGDARKRLAEMPAASVDLVLTSPPFLGLRSYLPVGDPAKALEMGSEPTPGEFLDTLLGVVEECRRVLAPHGSVVFELGDTYCGARGYGNPDSQNPAYGDRSTERWTEARVERHFKKADDGWPLDKSLCLIPELFRIALVYGFNPLTGRETPRWRARNVVRWCRPNPPVGALADKFRPATSDLLIACMSRKRYFDLDAVRTPSDYDRPNLRGQGARGPGEEVTGQKRNHSDHTVNDAGAPPLDWWEIPTQPVKLSHYATWPSALLERPIKAMCPARVCETCGAPSERIAETTNAVGHAVGQRSWANGAGGRARDIPDRNVAAPDVAERLTTGWTDCGHDAWRPGIVLDPFAGSGTTLAVAQGLGRSAIGIDLDRRNADLARLRVGMFLEVEEAVA
ncbi:MAG: site-specific DNA-methyltransferase [Actinobacteria bacterium]|nr:site-specific DNA-methyltransferase [Actinomycetota bacterium]